jgi:hypothetical protein
MIISHKYKYLLTFHKDFLRQVFDCSEMASVSICRKYQIG